MEQLKACGLAQKDSAAVTLLDPTGMILYQSRVLNPRKTPMKMSVENKSVENKSATRLIRKFAVVITDARQTVNV